MPLGGSGIHHHVAPWQGAGALSQLPSLATAERSGLGVREVYQAVRK